MHGTAFARIFAEIFILKKAIRHIAILLLAGIVLLASTGVSVHQLYCYCKGEVVASILPPDDPCEMASAPVQSAACCKGGICETPEKTDRHDCSDCTSEYVKLDAKYLVFSADFEVIAPAASPIFRLTPKDFPLRKNEKISWTQDIPPPAGKALLPWIQSYLC